MTRRNTITLAIVAAVIIVALASQPHGAKVDTGMSAPTTPYVPPVSDGWSATTVPVAPAVSDVQPMTTDTQAPAVSTVPSATTTVTGCTSTSASGTITNTGPAADTFLVVVGDNNGAYQMGSGNVQVVNLAAGATTNWTVPIVFVNPPTPPINLNCIVLAAEPN